MTADMNKTARRELEPEEVEKVSGGHDYDYYQKKKTEGGSTGSW